MVKLAVCSKCGVTFVKTFRDFCDKCYEKENESIQKVSTFLGSYSGKSIMIQDLSEQTGIDLEYMEQLYKIGKLGLLRKEYF